MVHTLEKYGCIRRCLSTRWILSGVAFLLTFSIIPSINGAWDTGYSLLCYYEASSYFREGVGRFTLSDFDPELCTHMIYSRVGISRTNEVYSRDPGLDLGPGDIEPNPDDPLNNIGDVDMIRKTVALREANKDLKVLLSIGGSEQSSESWSNMARHIANRTIFINSIKSWLEKYNLDGVDVHWEFPGIGSGSRPVEDKENFVKLLTELRTSLTTSEGGKYYLITGAFSCKKEIGLTSYNISLLSSQLDMFNLMCYDFKVYSAQTKLIGHHSPIHSKPTDTETDRQLTAEFGVNYFLESGAPKEKLMLGISAHARTFAVSNKNQFGEEATGSGPPGTFTQTESLLAYYEICLELTRNLAAWTLSFDYDYKVPYAYNQTMWIGYDDEISVALKVDFAHEKGLGGVVVNSVDMDDCKNLCQGWYNCPIVSSVKQKMSGF